MSSPNDACSECEVSFPKYFNKNDLRYCIFCKIINHPTSYDIYSYVWGLSELSQSNIIDGYRTQFVKYSQIVPPSMIDPCVKIIRGNPYIISQIKTNLESKTELESKIDFESKLKVFFTNYVDHTYLRSQNIFNKSKSSSNKIILDWNLSEISYRDPLIDEQIKIYLSNTNPADFFI